jgi:hypothetical protein
MMSDLVSINSLPVPEVFPGKTGFAGPIVAYDEYDIIFMKVFYHSYILVTFGDILYGYSFSTPLLRLTPLLWLIYCCGIQGLDYLQ